MHTAAKPGGFSTKKEGWKIVDVAATWEGTPYVMAGAHMAIHAPFPEGHPKRNTGVMHRGREVPNDFYTAFNDRTWQAYSPYNIATFRGDRFRVFRYVLLPGDEGC